MAKTYFYYSAMNAGKSTTLLQSSYNYKERGMDTILFAPAFDDRFGDPAIYSRIGLKQEAVLFDIDFNIFDYIDKVRSNFPNLRCILIDEAHFMTKAQVAQVIAATKEFDVAALCYGLRSDFKGEPFEGSIYLLAWAEEMIEIKTICHCGSKAIMNMRVDSEGNPVKSGSQVQIGGNESYTSVCMKHYINDVGSITEYAFEKVGVQSTTPP
ncbi:thymidine kinase [Candidatus Neptunochlamydia vexilliferae]|uniref:Thymidine kinase n=1 Tax=Candidatus Neptunichlamydia vexilliferae TaxID=1651774 RepID=A0ABS0B0W5_9BACT|nr:thymidine kinase [Candidatus Neptunochlamydia vexilliferae]MBF5060034.1 Thymidine kinase [Candidatus Neptunochlamydia vexilliferae]